MSGKQPETAVNAETSWWQSSLKLWGGQVVLASVAIACIVTTWYLASSPMGSSFREMPWSWQLGTAVLGGILILLLGLWMRASEVQRQWHAFTSAIVTITPTLVKPLLVVGLGAVLTLCYLALDSANDVESLRTLGVGASRRTPYLLGILVLCSLPALLTTCVSLLIERRMLRGDFAFVVDPTLEADQKVLVGHVRQNWEYERAIMEGSIQRMGRHAAILGFLASSIIATCVVISMTASGSDAAWSRMALAVGTAATISFTMHLAQIFFRSASNDATARMMAWASRTLLVVSVCALFFSALGDSLLPASSAGGGGEPAPPGQAAPPEPVAPPEPPAQATPTSPNPLSGRTGALLIGVAVALLGERMLRSVMNRAAGILGVDGLAPAQPGDLSAIDGLREEDAARLAEERIDSVHALAFTPTARIFFNTVYGLHRICDWQDQALLIARVGRTNALMLREQYFIRGAIAARNEARRLFGGQAPAGDAPANAAQPVPPAPPAEGVPTGGTGSVVQDDLLKRALRSLAEDKDIERLEVFWRSIPVLSS
jgi:hypothetical protein